MAVTVASFVASYPEFATAPPSLLTQYLADALVFTPAGLWGDLADQGVQLRAARALALSPYGRRMAMVAKDGSTAYDARLAEVTRIIGSGGFVP